MVRNAKGTTVGFFIKPKGLLRSKRKLLIPNKNEKNLHPIPKRI